MNGPWSVLYPSAHPEGCSVVTATRPQDLALHRAAGDRRGDMEATAKVEDAQHRKSVVSCSNANQNHKSSGEAVSRGAKSQRIFDLLFFFWGGGYKRLFCAGIRCVGSAATTRRSPLGSELSVPPHQLQINNRSGR